MTSLNFILFNLIYIIDKNMLKAMNNIIIMSEIRSMEVKLYQEWNGKNIQHQCTLADTVNQNHQV